MAPRRTIDLTTSQKTELQQAVATAPRPYLRERAAAILKVAAGQSPRQVALHGLLRERDPDTVYAWLDRYLAEGLPGLHIRGGRGRKPAFSPSAGDAHGGAGGDFTSRAA